MSFEYVDLSEVNDSFVSGRRGGGGGRMGGGGFGGRMGGGLTRPGFAGGLLGQFGGGGSSRIGGGGSRLGGGGLGGALYAITSARSSYPRPSFTPEAKQLGSALAGAFYTIGALTKGQGKDGPMRPPSPHKHKPFYGPSYSYPAYNYPSYNYPYYDYGGYASYPFWTYPLYASPYWITNSYWPSPYFYGVSPYSYLYDPTFSYTLVDPTPAVETVGAAQTPSLVNNLSILNFSAVPVRIRVTDRATGKEIEHVLESINNTLSIPITSDVQYAVGFSAPNMDAYYYPQTMQGNLLRRLDTPLREEVVEYRLMDPNIKIIRIGEKQYQIENVTK